MLIAGPLQATTVWDVGDDFSSTTNPLGQWAYGQMDAMQAAPYTSTFTPYPIYDALGSVIAGIEGWEATVASNNNSNITHNPAVTTVNAYSSNWYPNAVVLHPFGGGAARLTSGARWTAPADGVYDVASSFTRVHYQSTVQDVPVAVYHDSTLLFGSMTAGVDVAVPYDNSGVSMAAGDALYFFAQPNIAWGSVAWTQLDATITLVPEPGMLALLATGLIGLLCYAWRKRR